VTIHEPRHTDCDVSCTACDWYSTEPQGRSWSDHLPDSLDAAWAEAEAALPDKRWQVQLRGDWEEGWGAAYISASGSVDTNTSGWFHDPDDHRTPAAALRALAAKLRERPS
jgi:hypothetical protein